ncbi:MAG: rhomboid family intramembrane serine protease [bacterium]
MIPLKDENPTRTFPFFTILLILLNTAVFFYEMSLGIENARIFINKMGLIPSELLRGRHLLVKSPVPVQLNIITSIFLHGSLMHLLGNMLYLWIFGNNIEDYLGHAKFLIFYFACGILATITHTVVNINSNVPIVGASGAISGILGAYLLLYPRAKILVLVPIFIFIQFIKIPAIVVIGFWIVFQFLNGITSLGVGEPQGIAWFAHIGGFAVGIVLIRMLKRK